MECLNLIQTEINFNDPNPRPLVYKRTFRVMSFITLFMNLEFYSPNFPNSAC